MGRVSDIDMGMAMGMGIETHNGNAMSRGNGLASGGIHQAKTRSLTVGTVMASLVLAVSGIKTALCCSRVL